MTTESAVLNARPALGNGKTGPGQPPSHVQAYGQGPAAFKQPLLPLQPGQQAAMGPPFEWRFIPPLALFNDATQWVQRRFFVRPMPVGQTNGFPRLRAQYGLGSPPVTAGKIAAGNANLQQQLGQMAIQAQRLVDGDSNFFGGH